jgi:cystathionine beta-lyase
MTHELPGRVTSSALATDEVRLDRLFHSEAALLPLWIAEPYVDLAPEIVAVIEARAHAGWYGYETRPSSVVGAFWDWMALRHDWDGSGLHTSVSPSIGTSIGVLIEWMTDPGDGVILQPPVFTDFKPIVRASSRRVVRNPLLLSDAVYQMDLEDLTRKAADPSNRVLILCNPHNPVGRAWTHEELEAVAGICAANDIFVIADEIHADLALPPHRFTPFAMAAAESDVAWAATHGPIKTFGLAGICDTLLVTANEEVGEGFRATSSRLHLTRNNVFATAAFETAYREGGPWLEEMLELVSTNIDMLQERLPGGIGLRTPEATYLAWLDFRELRLDVPELAAWITAAGLALSPGHWFGREGAGFARMTVAAPSARIDEAIRRLTRALQTSDA